MKYGKPIVAAALALCLLLAASGCKYTSNTLVVTDPYAGTQIPPVSYEQPSSTEPGITDATLPSVPDTTLPPVPENTTAAPIPVENTTAAPAPSESATAQQPTTERDPSSWSKQEVVSYLSNAVNKTKAYTGQITANRTEDLGITIEELSPNLPALKGVANSLIERFIKPVNEVVSFSGGKGMSDGEEIPLLLPKRQGFTLTADGVTQATAQKSGENIIIDITLVQESSSMTSPPKYNAQGLGYLDISAVDISGVTIQSLDFIYQGSTIHAVIRPDGYVASAKYHIPLHVSASGKALGTISASFSGTGYQTETWDINW